MNAARANKGRPDTVSNPPEPEVEPDTSRLTPLGELQLVERHKQGDHAATEHLLESYQRRIYGICHRILGDADEASDVTQDVIVRLLESLDGYDARSKLSTWVYRIATNCCLSYLRKRKLRRHLSLETEQADRSAEGRPTRLGAMTASAELSGDQHVEQAEAARQMVRALETIDPQMRAILVLRDLQGLDYLQLSEVLEVPVGTIKSRLFRARAALREALEEAESSARDGGD